MDIIKIQIVKYRNILIGMFAVFIFLASARVSEWSSIYILENFPNKAIPDDILFELIPYNLAYEYLTEAIFYTMVFIFFYFVIKNVKEKLAYFWSISWIYMFSRAFLNLLTPLERPLAPDLMHGLLRFADPTQVGTEIYYRMGMFPSGHLGMATILYLAVRQIAPKWVDRLMLSLLFLEAIFMIASRGHYTIDILGGISFGILLFLFAEKYLKKYLVMN